MRRDFPYFVGMPKVSPFHSRPQILFFCLLGGYSLLVIYWMLFGFNRQVGDTPQYNLVPFTTIKLFFKLYHTHHMAAATNLIGNVVIFVPFGVLIPLVFGGKWGRMLLIFVSCIVALEVAQFVLRRGSLDVDDLMLNVVGAAMGYYIYSVISRKVKRSDSVMNR